MSFRNEQEEFWAGEFGDDYISRNRGDELLASNINFFSRILQKRSNIKSVIEFGSNIGMNLKALDILLPNAEKNAIEINKSAVEKLKEVIPEENIFNDSILNFNPENEYDLAFIKGVLIHINPSDLEKVYEKLVKSTGKYLLVAEYYNPSPVEIPYRGHSGKLFKRDFAGEILARYPELTLIDYGFVYHKDPLFPQDDVTWFLLKKNI